MGLPVSPFVSHSSLLTANHVDLVVAWLPFTIEIIQFLTLFLIVHTHKKIEAEVTCSKCSQSKSSECCFGTTTMWFDYLKSSFVIIVTTTLLLIDKKLPTVDLYCCVTNWTWLKTKYCRNFTFQTITGAHSAIQCSMLGFQSYKLPV